uniref:Group II intron-encoded reverse transcriptase maturase n=1 Tax=Enterobacter cloacae TaxID=550 RepID=A0A1S6XYB6_ENTCL|nr:group II intron reverse transcriptase/maturase [Enterobacter cloacae]AQX35407.1 group II intron-encoded reverse transcriptase maturase [Enterobacter cloacae]
MTVQSKIRTGASSHYPAEWHSIDWAKCYREVRGLQARIVKATREGKTGKVQSLQWVLTHSFSGKALAVRRVTENKGRRTPGVDGITWSTPEAKFQAILSLTRRGYRPQPLRRLLIPKRNGKLRPLGIPTMRDRAMQALYLFALEPLAETTADRRSFGFRPKRSTSDAIEQCFTVLSKKDSAQWILEGDIKGCFDNISHNWLLGHITVDRTILRKWLKAGYMENRQLFPTDSGTPQGGIISPTLANLALDGLEAELSSTFRVRRVRGKDISPKINYVRYADDFIITGTSKEILDNEVRPLVEAFMQNRGLTLSPEKTRITHINEGFDFLGQNIRKYDGKLLIKPSKTSISDLLSKVRLIVKGNKAIEQSKLIEMLNPLISGWANYHQHVVSKAIYAKVDHEIWCALWRWARRRHPQKGCTWVKRRYFRTQGSRNWIFAVKTAALYPDGKPVLISLRKAVDTRVIRHRKIRLEANAFDPQWETYFEERAGLKMQNTLKGRKKLTSLWSSQGGVCPVCKVRITSESGWHIHHLIRRTDGGENGNNNLVMVHPTCHRQIHANNLSIVKPVRESGSRKA